MAFPRLASTGRWAFVCIEQPLTCPAGLQMCNRESVHYEYVPSRFVDSKQDLVGVVSPPCTAPLPCHSLPTAHQPCRCCIAGRQRGRPLGRACSHNHHKNPCSTHACLTQLPADDVQPPSPLPPPLFS